MLINYQVVNMNNSLNTFVKILLLTSIFFGICFADTGLPTTEKIPYSVSSAVTNAIPGEFKSPVTATEFQVSKSGSLTPSGSLITKPTLVAQPTLTTTPLQVTSGYATDRIIVRYKTDSGNSMATLPKVMSAANTEAGAFVVSDYSTEGLTGTQVVTVKGASINDAITSYSANPNVLYAEPDYIISLYPNQPVSASDNNPSFSTTSAALVNDPEFSLQWGLKNNANPSADIKAPDAWTITKGSSSVVIAIVDTGVEYTHSDLSGNIWKNTGEIPNNGKDDDRNGYVDDVYGWNFAGKNGNPTDDNGHGTHCAGIIAAVTNNNNGVAGVCWKAQIMPLKFLTASGSGYVSDAISAILYANKMGAHIISNSWGGSQSSQALKDAIDASKAVVVCAAGNSGVNTDSKPQYPSAYSSSNIIAVAATDKNDNLASFSNYGISSVDIAAPGVDIRSTYRGSQFKTISGTSMATPFVSGVAGLVKATNPGMSNSQIKSRILSSVDKLSSLNGKVLSGGRLNAAKSVGYSTTSPTPTRTPTPIQTPVSGNLIASFIASPLAGKSPLKVQFADTSIGKIKTWVWEFGDGGISYQKNPTYYYQNNGVYTVKLRVYADGKSSSITKSRLITVNSYSSTPTPTITPSPTSVPGYLTASFIASPTSGKNPLKVQFLDTSSGYITNWEWTFGDGGISYQKNPAYYFRNKGVYSVKLTVSGGGKSSTYTRSRYVTVT